MRYFKTFIGALIVLVALTLLLISRHTSHPQAAHVVTVHQPMHQPAPPAALPTPAQTPAAPAAPMNALVGEAVDRARAEQSDLRSRQHDLDAEIADSTALISAQKARIAALQKELQQRSGSQP